MKDNKELFTCSKCNTEVPIYYKQSFGDTYCFECFLAYRRRQEPLETVSQQQKYITAIALYMRGGYTWVEVADKVGVAELSLYKFRQRIKNGEVSMPSIENIEEAINDRV